MDGIELAVARTSQRLRGKVSTLRLQQVCGEHSKAHAPSGLAGLEAKTNKNSVGREYSVSFAPILPPRSHDPHIELVRRTVLFFERCLCFGSTHTSEHACKRVKFPSRTTRARAR